MIRLANRTRVRSARYARYLYPVLFILLDYVAILLAEQEALGLHHLIDRISRHTPSRRSTSTSGYR